MVGLCLILVGVVSVLAFVPLTYQASASEVLIAPPLPAGTAAATGNIGAQNALLGFNDALNVDASILITVVGDPAERAAMRAAGATAAYTLSPSIDGVTPLVEVTASSKSPAAAQRTVALVMAETKQVLAARQAAVGAPADTLIRTSQLSPVGPATRHWKVRIEYLLIICLVGALLTYLAALTWDRLATRHQVAPEPPSQDGKPDPPSDEAGKAGVEAGSEGGRDDWWARASRPGSSRQESRPAASRLPR